ncbi:hypothetical protein BP5796_11326 [Coleophoma crateriformis]|uniref:Uncharacterized protein n=1 Tax=Coleophoma crateriformis TaxID=565419 RepID=A0A3D8QJ22_9HELO|nr:hypothetical protein BP5796_11326 [Coleophoma crateriformis]
MEATQFTPSASCSQLLGAIDQAIQSLQPPDLELTGISTDRLSYQYQALREVVDSFRAILAVYENHERREELDYSPVVDPTFFDWIANCSTTVCCMQEEIDKQAGAINSDGFVEIAMPGEEADHALKNLADSLDDNRKLLSEFLPILRCDLDEFLAAHAGQAYISQNLEDNTLPYPPTLQGDIHTLKSKLYGLSDTIKMCLETIDRFNSSEGLTSVMGDLRQDLQKCVQVLTEVLTNNGSEWIESMIQGKLTYAEFCDIDVEDVMSLDSAFRKFNDALHSHFPPSPTASDEESVNFSIAENATVILLSLMKATD